MSIEEEALAFGNDPAKVQRRLMSTVCLLHKEYYNHFRKFTYDAQKRMLLAGTERYALIWQLRNRPDQPIGYYNQQTNQGVVILIPIGAWQINPN